MNLKQVMKIFSALFLLLLLVALFLRDGNPRIIERCYFCSPTINIDHGTNLILIGEGAKPSKNCMDELVIKWSDGTEFRHSLPHKIISGSPFTNRQSFDFNDLNSLFNDLNSLKKK